MASKTAKKKKGTWGGPRPGQTGRPPDSKFGTGRQVYWHVPKTLVEWVEEQAEAEGLSPSAWVTQLLERSYAQRER